MSENKVPMQVSKNHFVNGNTIIPPFPSHLEQIIFGLGCFWGAERRFWQQSGVFSTAVGFTGGQIPHPTYDDVCTGLTNHNEVVKIIFDPTIISFKQLLVVFWESHNPTQGMRQGNDRGTQYRSGIYTFSKEQQDIAIKSQEQYQEQLFTAELGKITTEILNAPEFYYAEDYHQQYLAKNPQGYCGLQGLGISTK
ncbi:MAG: peptide-methionine (S)-S-oxide reductase MsrA [Methylococcaceae bacterium]